MAKEWLSKCRIKLYDYHDLLSVPDDPKSSPKETLRARSLLKITYKCFAPRSSERLSLILRCCMVTLNYDHFREARFRTFFLWDGMMVVLFHSKFCKDSVEMNLKSNGEICFSEFE